MPKGDNAGRPPIIQTPEQMEAAIDAYLADREPQIVLNAAGEPMLDKYGRPIFAEPKPVTVTGLARACGFKSRQSFLDYTQRNKSGKNEKGEEIFADAIARAKMAAEEYTEERLYDKEGTRGAQFSLANNFKGWNAKPDGVEVNNNLEIRVTLEDE